MHRSESPPLDVKPICRCPALLKLHKAHFSDGDQINLYRLQVGPRIVGCDQQPLPRDVEPWASSQGVRRLELPWGMLTHLAISQFTLEFLRSGRLIDKAAKI